MSDCGGLCPAPRVETAVIAHCIRNKVVKFKGAFRSELLKALQTWAPPTQLFALCLIRPLLRSLMIAPSLYCFVAPVRAGQLTPVLSEFPTNTVETYSIGVILKACIKILHNGTKYIMCGDLSRL